MLAHATLFGRHAKALGVRPGWLSMNAWGLCAMPWHEVPVGMPGGSRNKRSRAGSMSPARAGCGEAKGANDATARATFQWRRKRAPVRCFRSARLRFARRERQARVLPRLGVRCLRTHAPHVVVDPAP